ncbi:hypothetical protein ACM66B_000751 [Microbotryomycetes sp. NB124-2]
MSMPAPVPATVPSMALPTKVPAPRAESLPRRFVDTPRTTPPLSPSLQASAMSDDHLLLASAMLAADQSDVVVLDGYKLTLEQVVLAGRHRKQAKISDAPEIKNRIDESVEFLKSRLVNSVYGVTTGFGGSADTRTEDPLALQISLLEHQLCGVLPTSFDSFELGRGLENSLPLEVVRGAMLIRVNSLTRGHSAVRVSVLETLIRFLKEGITPVVPLRGSISASGDLSPLSYIAGAICGHPDIKVVTSINGNPEVMLAPEALKLHGIEKVVLGPKEGLGLVNGTAVSASFATHALYDTHFLTLLSQAVTAMTVEAMVGHVGSFHPFIHDVTRPHPGQIQVARNIRTMLESSQFAIQKEEEVLVKADSGILRQDRYPLRTSAQWIGPILTDLATAHATLQIELNSTTDNPLIDVQGGEIHHGGNFQAMAVSNAMEKIRLGLQQMGKLNYAQLTELLNCSMNRGLPSCLAAEDPSTSYHTKGLDIASAAYTSELGFLANPVTSHVQPAEMANQAVNSLALISARKTAEANDVLSMLLATHLYCVCQALDLRYLEFAFREKFNPAVANGIESTFGNFLSKDQLSTLSSKVTLAIWRRLEQTTSVDLEPRWTDAFAHVSSLIVDALTVSTSTENPLPLISKWKSEAAAEAVALTRQVRDEFWTAKTSPTAALLGKTKALYTFVRETVGVKARRGDVFLGKQEQTVGLGVSKIYDSIKSGKMNTVLVDMMH